MEISSEHLHAQTVQARELQFLEKVHLPPPVMCHVTCVMFLVSCVMCHMSWVAKKYIYKKNIIKKYGQSGGSCWWRVCYQRGLPRLVYYLNGRILFTFSAKQLNEMWQKKELIWLRIRTVIRFFGGIIKAVANNYLTFNTFMYCETWYIYFFLDPKCLTKIHIHAGENYKYFFFFFYYTPKRSPLYI